MDTVLDFFQNIWSHVGGFFTDVTSDRWLIYLAIFLMVIDIFFSSDLPTFVSYLLFTIVIFRHLPGHIILRLTLSVFVFFGFVFIYFYFWSRLKTYILDKLFSRDVIQTGMDSLIGETGTVRVVDGIQAAKIRGDIYSFVEEVPYGDGTPFTVKSIEGGMIVPEFSADAARQDTEA